MKKHYLIYQVRNKLNGMIYIGQHQTKNIDDDYMGSGIRIRRAIEKYGIENFEKTILFDFDNFDEMNLKETEIVTEEFVARDDVYNLIPGGFGNWNYVNDFKLNVSGKWKTVRQYCRDIYEKTGKWPNERWLDELKDTNPQKYFAFCKSVSDGVKKHYKKHGSWWKGKHHSEEAKNKIKDYHKKFHPQAGSKNSQYGKIAIYNIETFETAMQFKDQPIPAGWAKGRFYNATKEELIKRKNILTEILKINSESKASIRMSSDKLELILNKLKKQDKISKSSSIDVNRELKRIERQRQIQEKEKLLTEQYAYYKEFGWEAFVKKYDYQYSYPNFVQQCKLHVKEFVPQNGKKRGKQIFKS